MPFEKPEDTEGPSADYYDSRLHELEVGQIDQIIDKAVEEMENDQHKLRNWSPEDDDSSE